MSLFRSFALSESSISVGMASARVRIPIYRGVAQRLSISVPAVFPSRARSLASSSSSSTVRESRPNRDSLHALSLSRLWCLTFDEHCGMSFISISDFRNIMWGRFLLVELCTIVDCC